MEKLNRGDKIFLDKDGKEESAVNQYLDCREGIVKLYEYRDMSGYGSENRLFLCEDTKHEHVSIIRQVYIEPYEKWSEETMSFDSDSFAFLKALFNAKEELGGKYTLLRDY